MEINDNFKIDILPKDVHNSWKEFIKGEMEKELIHIQLKIGNNYTPDTKNVLRFTKNDLNTLKVVILGQDPYPEKGRATGRCFEVGNLKSWNDKFKQVSLKNIIRLIYKSYKNITNYSEIEIFSKIQKEIVSEKFEILPPDSLFENWEKQGVLLLNTSLTCEVGKSDSHRKVWNKFTTKLLKYISEHNKDLYWFLWGSSAISYKKYISNGAFYQSRHPMMCFDKYKDDFLKSDCFKDTIPIINWKGQKS